MDLYLYPCSYPLNRKMDPENSWELQLWTKEIYGNGYGNEWSCPQNESQEFLLYWEVLGYLC